MTAALNGAPDPSPRVLIAAHVRWHNAEAEYVQRLVRGLLGRGVGVLVWGRPGSPLVERCQADGAPVVTAGDPASLRPGVMAATVRFLEKLIREAGVDLVNAHRSEGYPLIAWAARRAGAAVVRTRADMRPPRPGPLNRRLYRDYCDHLIVANDLSRQDLLCRFGLPEAKIDAIRMGLRPDELEPGPPPKGLKARLGLPLAARLIGVMGRIGPVKGQEFVLAAAPKIIAAVPDAHFAIIYRDLERSDKFLTALRRSGLMRRFVFIGPGRDHVAAMRLCEAAVIPSVGSEAHCRVALEWMALAKPVVGSRVGVVPELVGHGETGFLVQPRYADAIAVCLIELLQNPDRARRMGAAGREKLVAVFGEDRMVEQNLEVFRQVARRRGMGVARRLS